MYRKLIDQKLLLEDLGEEPYIWTDTDAEIQEHSDWLRFKEMIELQPAVDAVEVTADELKHLINDTIAYIWRLEERGCDTPEFGYDSRKALLEKLKRFKEEHFPEIACAYGERKDNG